jgi:hypothetical protein
MVMGRAAEESERVGHIMKSCTEMHLEHYYTIYNCLVQGHNKEPPLPFWSIDRERNQG